MDGPLQKPASASPAKRRSTSTARLILWGVVVATGLLSFFVSWMPEPLFLFAIAYGLDRAVAGRIRMTHENGVQGRRAKLLGAAFIAWGVAQFALGAYERLYPDLFAGLFGAAGFALVAALWGPLIALWILGMAWARPLREPPRVASKWGSPRSARSPFASRPEPSLQCCVGAPSCSRRKSLERLACRISPAAGDLRDTPVMSRAPRS
jgi:hypothetical protein